MKTVLICKSSIGLIPFELYLSSDNTCGSLNFYATRNVIYIPAGQSIDDTIDIFVHEALELYMISQGWAYRKSWTGLPDTSDGRTFMFNHADFTMIVADLMWTLRHCKPYIIKAKKKQKKK